MKNKYVDFISDKHFLTCVKNLHASYVKAKKAISKSKFFSNKIDTFKLTFDAKFNQADEKSVIESEILRQIDKSINNSIGTFHEQILGGIHGYEVGNLSGFDIKATDNSLFADIKNKHNTMNSSSSEALFQKLKRYADDYKQADCFWVQILAKSSFMEPWKGDINGKEYSHSRVFKISGDQFYARLSGNPDAFLALYKALPIVIDDYLKTIKKENKSSSDSAFSEIQSNAAEEHRSILDQITFENYGYYLGFDSL
jgi:hypothetical protein